MAVEVQLIHFGLDPIRAFVPFCECFLNAFGYLQQREYFFVGEDFGHRWWIGLVVRRQSNRKDWLGVWKGAILIFFRIGTERAVKKALVS